MVRANWARGGEANEGSSREQPLHCKSAEVGARAGDDAIGGASCYPADDEPVQCTSSRISASAGDEAINASDEASRRGEDNGVCVICLLDPVWDAGKPGWLPRAVYMKRTETATVETSKN